MHEADNKALFALLGLDGIPPFPTESVWKDAVSVWATCYTDVIESDFGAEVWAKAMDEVRAANGCPPDIDKTAYFIPDFLGAGWRNGGSSPMSERLAKAIFEDALRRIGDPKANAY